MRKLLFGLVLVCMSNAVWAQKMEAEKLFEKLRQKIDAIKDYQADVKMKIDISFMRVPPLNGTLYFKAPDKMKLERNGGISILPRRSMNMTLNNLLPSSGATVIDAGSDNVNGRALRIIKVVPEDDRGDIILTKIWVDEQRLLAVRTETTTRDNGTVKMDLEFGKFEKLGLPDKVVFYVDTREFKLPKGVTMDYDAAPKTTAAPQQGEKKMRKGRIQINYLNYTVNKGLSDAIFTENKK